MPSFAPSAGDAVTAGVRGSCRLSRGGGGPDGSAPASPTGPPADGAPVRIVKTTDHASGPRVMMGPHDRKSPVLPSSARMRSRLSARRPDRPGRGLRGLRRPRRPFARPAAVDRWTRGRARCFAGKGRARRVLSWSGLALQPAGGPRCATHPRDDNGHFAHHRAAVDTRKGKGDACARRRAPTRVPQPLFEDHRPYSLGFVLALGCIGTHRRSRAVCRGTRCGRFHAMRDPQCCGAPLTALLRNHTPASVRHKRSSRRG